MDIKKAKFKDDKVTVVYEQKTKRDDKNYTSNVTKESNIPPHADLINALKQLTTHLALITEQVNDTTSPQAANVMKNIKVTQLSIGGDDDQTGVTLVGMRTLSNGKVLNLVSPFTKFDDEYEDYIHIDQLFTDVHLALEEFEAYLNGKYAPAKQMELAEA